MQDLATVLSQKRGLTKAQAEDFVSSMFDVVNYGLDTERLVKVKGLGTFKVTNVKDRESINVNTGERVVISGHGKISFTPEAVLREMVNKPFSQFETVVLNEGVDFSQIDNAADLSAEASDDEIVGHSEAPSVEGEASVAKDETTQEKPTSSNTQDAVSVAKDAGSAPVAEKSTSEMTDNHEAQDTEAESSLEDATIVSADVKAPAVDAAEEKMSVIASADGEETVAGGEAQNDASTEEGTAAVVGEKDGESLNPEAVRVDSRPERSTAEDSELVAERETEEEETADDESAHKSSSVWKPILIGGVFLLLAAIAGFIGYYLGTRSSSSDSLKNQSSVAAPALKPIRKPVKKIVKASRPDTVANVKNVGVSTTAETDVKNKPEKIEEKPTKTPEKTEKKTEKSAESASSIASKYDQMDVRVRTGAYAIVGVNQIVTVKKGETLKSISDRYLGTGMDCYVEVLNGKHSVSAGERLSIPKLQLKKRLKK